MNNKIKVIGYIILVIIIIIFMIAVNENNKKRNIEEVISEMSTTVYPLGVAETTTEAEIEQTETFVESDDYDYRTLVEETIKKAIPEAKFSWVANYRTWTDGTFTMVENQFKINNIKHKYVARCGGGKLFHLSIDDEVVFYDEDGQWEFMTKE